MSPPTHDRVCGALIREGRILMVRHAPRGGREHWTLPGGHVEMGETFQAGIVREFREETGLEVRPARLPWEGTWGSAGGQERRDLIEAVDPLREPALGFDPEEAHLPSAARTLKAARWFVFAEMRDDVQVKRVLEALDSRRESSGPESPGGPLVSQSTKLV